MSGWLQALIEVLTHEGEEQALQLLAAVNPTVGQQLVDLVEGPVSASEALTYAAVLLEIGQQGSAMEILSAVIAPVAILS